ncbi:hypothetical protein BZB76_3761 [Actinomadura pelletieri DSM 43383]|uniref:Uncharacterized protein n=1 Tax=Actinomadura pelletieri DSM 43383 TaxID=1120940 RepID=A0A495QKF7_9ACTN|nr:hypothetical protein [Actinomadura pelletieri]RKS73077.1 hypothetical protein BZB76_3761 [Actinomadura pelletieri DSM 43383]
MATEIVAPPRSRLTTQLLLVCGGAVLLNLAMRAVADDLPGTAPEAASPAGRGVHEWIVWILGDTNEAQFYKTSLGGVGLLVFAAGAHHASRRRLRARGFDIAYGTGLWPWLLAASGAGLLLSNLLWGWTLAPDTWQPTFVPFVSVAPAVVLVYGAGWRVALTAAGLGAVLTTPVSILVVEYVCGPLELPAVVGNVTGMWVGALLAFLICRGLPWMSVPPPAPQTPDAETDPVTAEPDPVPDRHPDHDADASGWWLPRRALADFTEAQFYGNEWASLGLVGGAVLAWAVDTMGPAYGSGVFPDLLTAQILTAVLGVWLYAGQWRRHGWYPTFVPVVSFAPAAVIVMGGGWPVILLASVTGAAAGPPLARAIAARLPADFHPFVGSVMSMTVITSIGVPVLKLLDSAGLI